MSKKLKKDVADEADLDIGSIAEQQILKQFGDVILSASVLKEHRGEIIPTTLALDLGLSGGIPEGVAVSIAGVASSGKTTLCLTIIANAQKQGRKCYYIDVEGRLQDSLLDTIPGLDVSKLKVIRSNKEVFLTAEMILNIVDQLISADERILIVFDSVAALCVAQSHESAIGETKKMMGLPTLMYDSLRRTAQRLVPMKSNIIFITHLQANPSPYGNGLTRVGGKAIEYFSSVTLTCMSSRQVPKDTEPKTGRESTFKIEKAALGPATGNAEFYIRYRAGYNRAADIFNLALELGLIAKKGGWYAFDNNNEEMSLQGEQNVIKYLNDNEAFADSLETQIRELMLPQKEAKNESVS